MVNTWLSELKVCPNVQHSMVPSSGYNWLPVPILGYLRNDGWWPRQGNCNTKGLRSKYFKSWISDSDIKLAYRGEQIDSLNMTVGSTRLNIQATNCYAFDSRRSHLESILSTIIHPRTVLLLFGWINSECISTIPSGNRFTLVVDLDQFHRQWSKLEKEDLRMRFCLEWSDL